LVRDELEFLAKKYPTRFQLHYTVDRAPKGWTYSEGFVTKEMIAQHVCSSPSPTRQIFMCGPPPMIKFACLPNLKELGFEEKDYDVF
jgi:cytochrome-b5 reductase